MTKMDYLKLLVDEIHSTTVATIGSDGHPQTRIIDMMYYDEEGVYFLTAKGKAFYDQLMEQQYVAISATKDKIAVSLRGKIKNIGKKNFDIMFEKNVLDANCVTLYVRKNALIYLQFRLLSTRIIVCIAEDVQKFVRSSVLRKEVHYDF